MAVLKDLVRQATPILFFTGKGGVGKTSSACACAIGLAETGKRVLLVSTDPASNLDEVLGVTLGPAPTAIPQAPGLMALNIDPEQAAFDYRERTVAPHGGDSAPDPSPIPTEPGRTRGHGARGASETFS